MSKNAYFGPIWAIFWSKILIFMEVSKSFGTNLTENHFGSLSTLYFGQSLDQMGQKCRYLAKNAKKKLEKVIIFRHKQTFFVIHGGCQLIFKMFRYVASSVFNKQGGLAPKDLEPSLFIYQAVQLAKSGKTSTNSQIAPHSFTFLFRFKNI